MSNVTVEYFSKDFDWEKLREEIENDPSLSYHTARFDPSSSSSCSSSSTSPLPEKDSEPWKSFHIRHSTGRFFKERRYLLKEFPELILSDTHCKVLEVGCGNGSTALPILRGNENITVYACDCSNEALEMAKDMINANCGVSVKQRFYPFYCDFSETGLPKWLSCYSCCGTHKQKRQSCSLDVEENNGPKLSLSEKSNCCIGGLDFVTLIFTLSALPLHKMATAVTECFSVLKPGGLLLFRDYGLYDMTMLRFEPVQRVGFREYVRSDGTRSYFFCLDTVRNLFMGAGFTELELEYCCVRSVNRRKGKNMQRVWVHGKFQKPILS